VNLPALLTPLLRQRVLCLALLLSGLGLLVFERLGTSVWTCPFQQTTGLPCPGCGFTRGTLRLLAGDWRMALSYHPFTPLVVPAIALLLFAAAAPSAWLQRCLPLLDRFERCTGFALLVLLAFVGFGVWRMVHG
jgi:hypothetical protein